MKYIIDIPEDAEYGILTYRRVDGGFCTKDIDITETEQLTSDYINEHFSDLQDEAYQRGLKDGRNETWEAARKIVLYRDEGGTSILDLTEIFDCCTIQQVFRKYTVFEIIEKLKAHEEKQKAGKDVKRGDVVIDEDGIKFWVTKINNGIAEGIMANGEVTCTYLNVTESTGKHFDIDKILEGMKE